MSKVVVFVDGGEVQAAYTDGQEVEVDVVDFSRLTDFNHIRPMSKVRAYLGQHRELDSLHRVGVADIVEEPVLEVRFEQRRAHSSLHSRRVRHRRECKNVFVVKAA